MSRSRRRPRRRMPNMEREGLSIPQQDTGRDLPWDMDRRTLIYRREFLRVWGLQYEEDQHNLLTQCENTRNALLTGSLPPEQKTPKPKMKKERGLDRDENTNQIIPAMVENVQQTQGLQWASHPPVISMETLLTMQNLEEERRPVQETGLNCGSRPFQMGRAWREDLPELASDPDAESPESLDEAVRSIGMENRKLYSLSKGGVHDG
ncbi:uncharacterized protein [Aquarana catesbeiana]|uniref:uncharacterized protein n=1 Tax=Aquarana catesbeiana TaxID=8400 RepID=UPI003CCA02F5